MYYGEWKFGVKHGFGYEKSNNEEGDKIYEGEYFLGVRHGFGRLTLPNDSFFYGYWLHGKKNNDFSEHSISDNSFFIKYYENDREIKLIEELSKLPPEKGNKNFL